MSRTFDRLVDEVRDCTVCAAHLPLGPRPVMRGNPSARVMIIGQAPGAKVHSSGVPWDDASGRRLRDWLDLDNATFYDEALIAIVPMGFCYPGANPKGGDNPLANEESLVRSRCRSGTAPPRPRADRPRTSRMTHLNRAIASFEAMPGSQKPVGPSHDHRPGAGRQGAQ